MDSNIDAKFTGSISKLDENYLVPLIFQSSADDLAKRVLTRSKTHAVQRIRTLMRSMQNSLLKACV